MGLFSFFSNNTTTSDAIQLLDAKTFRAAIAANENVQVVDVRTAMEFQQGHFDNAINISFFDSNFVTQMERFDKSKPIYLYCKSGNRSGKAAGLLAAKGFEEIYDLKGGY